MDVSVARVGISVRKKPNCGNLGRRIPSTGRSVALRRPGRPETSNHQITAGPGAEAKTFDPLVTFPRHASSRGNTY